MHSSFTLPDSYGFNNNYIKTTSFTQNNRLSCFSGNSAQGVSGSRRTYISILVFHQFFHTGFVTKNTSVRNTTARVNSQNRNFFTQSGQVFSESFDKRTFSYSGNSCDSDTNRIISKRKTTV